MISLSNQQLKSVMAAARSLLAGKRDIPTELGHRCMIATQGDAETVRWSHVESILKSAESTAGLGELRKVLEHLRELSLDEFGELLLSMPNHQYPHLSALLPQMAEPNVQKAWTGAEGYALLRQTVTFARLLRHNFLAITKQPLMQRSILDFGCGWGRIIRILYYFTDPSMIYGCDPWAEAINICKANRISGNLAISDYLPQTLPFEGQRFDLIYAFSVFTHLSERAAEAAIRILTQRLAKNGLLVITIRPVEFWRFLEGLSEQQIAVLEAEHANRGFAFLPHIRDPIQGDITYGDTSMSVEYFRNKFPALKLRTLEHTLDDPYQIVLFLTAR